MLKWIEENKSYIVVMLEFLAGIAFTLNGLMDSIAGENASAVVAFIIAISFMLHSVYRVAAGK